MKYICYSATTQSFSSQVTLFLSRLLAYFSEWRTLRILHALDPEIIHTLRIIMFLHK